MRSVLSRNSLGFARIASTLFFAVLCVGSIVLWVRSYSYADGGMFSVLPGQHVAFHGGCGRMCVWFEHSAGTRWFAWHSNSIRERVPPTADNRIPIFHLKAFWPKMTRLYIAHWFIVVVTATVALAPWVPRRISVRGLMIAVTAIAMMIALIAWIDRTF